MLQEGKFVKMTEDNSVKKAIVDIVKNKRAETAENEKKLSTIEQTNTGCYISVYNAVSNCG